MLVVAADDAGLLAFVLGEPVILELALLLLLAIPLWLRYRQLEARGRDVESHVALDDLLLGYEALLAHDMTTASHRLTRACAEAPSDRAAAQALTIARRMLAGSLVNAEQEDDRPPGFDDRIRDVDVEPRSFARFLTSATELSRRLDAPRRVVDALEVNRQHLHRLIDDALAHDDAALAELRELGTMAAGELLRRGASELATHAELVTLTIKLGSDVLPALFAALREPTSALGADRNIAARFVVAVAIAQPDAATAPVLESARSREPILRDLSLDIAIALCNPTVLSAVAASAARSELIRALERAEPAHLASLLRSLPTGHVVLRTALEHPTPMVLSALVEALPGAHAAPEMRARILATDALRTLGGELVDRAVGGQPAARQLVSEAGAALAEPLALCATDLARPPAQREQARGLLVALRGQAVDALIQTLGTTATPADEVVLDTLVEIGADAVLPLRDLLQAILAGADPARDEHCAMLATDALARIATAGSRRVLEALRRQSRLPGVTERAQRLLDSPGTPRRAKGKRDG